MADFAQAFLWLKEGKMVSNSASEIVYFFSDHFNNGREYLGWKRITDFANKRTHWKEATLTGGVIFSEGWRIITVDEINRTNEEG